MKQEIPIKAKELINLGVAEFYKKRYASAIILYKKALRIQPDLVLAISNLVSAYNQLKKYKEAGSYLKILLKLDKNDLNVNFNAGHYYFGIKEYSKAISYFLKVIKLNLYHQDAYLLLGICYAEITNFRKAIETYNKGLTYFPDNLDYLNNLAKIYLDMGDRNKAINLYTEITKIDPKAEFAYSNLAGAYFQINDYELVTKYIKKALKIKPNNFDALMRLADIYNFKHQYTDSIALYKAAHKIKPKDPGPMAGLYDQYRNLCDWDKSEDLEKLDIFKKTMSSFTILQAFDDPHNELAASRREAEKHITNLRSIFPKRVRAKDGKRKIRLGLFSADFKDHPVGHLIKGFFDHYDKKRFELYVYSFGQNDGSLYRQSAESKADVFYDMFGWSDIQMAEKIYDDCIDILVDLMGYTQHSRPSVLAMKPAPVQIQYLGYPATSGASYIDYLIADKIVIPNSLKKYYSEKVLYTPGSFMPCDVSAQPNFKQYKEDDFNLPEDSIIFSSFCGASKIDQQSFRLWMEILKKTDKSVLWLRNADTPVRANLKSAASTMGVKPNRIIFSERMENKNDHLARLSLADIALDTLVYGGHTTTVDFLTANVPVITKIGNHFAGRVAASILTAADLKECIVTSEQAYVDLAVELARNHIKLKELKIRLNKSRNTADFFQSKKYVINLEKALLTSLGTSVDGIGIVNIAT